MLEMPFGAFHNFILFNKEEPAGQAGLFVVPDSRRIPNR
jgi:hypothetical protein